MSVEELLSVAPSPAVPVETGPIDLWEDVERQLGTALPDDYRDFTLRYGSGYFDDFGRLLIFVRNPFTIDYLPDLERSCDELRSDRNDLRREPNVPYGVFPHQPGWLPWGSDIDGNLMCWLTEGKPNEWPVILLSGERTSFQQLPVSMTTFLARSFVRRMPSILWSDPSFFASPEPIRFVPKA